MLKVSLGKISNMPEEYIQVNQIGGGEGILGYQIIIIPEFLKKLPMDQFFVKLAGLCLHAAGEVEKKDRLGLERYLESQSQTKPGVMPACAINFAESSLREYIKATLGEE